jgi:hypothetical protein
MRERPWRISADNSNRFAPGVDSGVRRGDALSPPGVAGVEISRDNLDFPGILCLGPRRYSFRRVRDQFGARREAACLIKVTVAWRRSM